jgi:hypothetical protein
MIDDLTQVGLSERCHSKLKRLQEDQHFAEMRDAYRFAIALGLARGIRPPELGLPKQTIFGVATLDPDREIALSVAALMDTDGIPAYRWAERLAEWGVEELAKESEKGQLDISRLLSEAKLI